MSPYFALVQSTSHGVDPKIHVACRQMSDELERTANALLFTKGRNAIFERSPSLGLCCHLSGRRLSHPQTDPSVGTDTQPSHPEADAPNFVSLRASSVMMDGNHALVNQSAIRYSGAVLLHAASSCMASRCVQVWCMTKSVCTRLCMKLDSEGGY